MSRFFIFLLLGGSLLASPSPYDEVYSRIASELARQSSVFGEPDSTPPAEGPEGSKFNPDVWLRGKAGVRLGKNTLKIKSIGNSPLYDKTDALRGHRDKNLIPRYSFADAVAKARFYLKVFGFELPENTRLKTVAFNKVHPHLWEVRWEPCWGGYPLDDFSSLAESVYVFFHEEDGLYCVGSDLAAPAPKSLAVNYSRDAAIAKGARLSEDVMRSPHYLMARRSGFKVVALVSCELKVAIPNWHLDPKRVVWIREKPPEETRLTWVVRYSTVDSLAAERAKNDEGVPMTLMRPDIVIYIDADSGECVGADFS